jgi:thymidylate synthase
LKFYDAWLELASRVLVTGHSVKPRGMEVRELTATQVTFRGSESLMYHPDRGLNYRFAVAEWLWMLAGSDAVEPLARYNSQMRQFSDNGVSLDGAYGPRFMPQVSRVVDTLIRDSDSRQAVMVIWRPEDAWYPPSKDVPCTISCQFLRRDGELQSIWTMRSNDLWLGLPYDAYTFSQVTAAVAGLLKVPVGDVTVQVGSSHIYEQHFEAAGQVMRRWEEGHSIHSPALPGLPPFDLTRFLLDPQGRSSFDEPWETYAQVLESKRSADALKLLETWR